MNEIYQIDEKIVQHNLHNLKHLIFEVTEKCNLKCKYCGLSSLYKVYDVRKNRNMPFKKTRLIIDYFLNLWQGIYVEGTVFPTTISFYGGEPLMNMTLIKQIIDYLEQSKIRGKHFNYSMTTNAMLLDKYMDYLVEKKFRLLISLDGDEYAQSYRIDQSNKNSFSRVFGNLKLLQNKHLEYFVKFVRFNSVLHNRNNVEPIYQFIREQFDKTPSITPLSTFGISKDKIDEFRKMYQNKTESMKKSKNCESIEAEMFINTPNGYQLSTYLYSLSGNIFQNYNELLLHPHENNKIYTGTCIPFSKKMFITVSGKILPCERVDHDFELGYVHNDYVELDYERVAKRHNYFLSKCAKHCVRCATNKFCLQCVYSMDDIRKETPYCSRFCSKKEFDLTEKKIFDFLRQYPHYYEKVLNEVYLR